MAKKNRRTDAQLSQAFQDLLHSYLAAVSNSNAISRTNFANSPGALGSLRALAAEVTRTANNLSVFLHAHTEFIPQYEVAINSLR